MGADALLSHPYLEGLFSAQYWVQERLQALPEMRWNDPYKLATVLIIAPLLEEVIYRGPMFLSRNTAIRPLWWMIGILLSVLFAVSHDRKGLALLPLFVMGICSLWLIASTHRFWPSIGLHFLHNFFFASVVVYQSIWVAD